MSATKSIEHTITLYRYNKATPNKFKGRALHLPMLRGAVAIQLRSLEVTPSLLLLLLQPILPAHLPAMGRRLDSDVSEACSESSFLALHFSSTKRSIDDALEDFLPHTALLQIH